ncbi:hypothetical protein EJB05_11843, partial [Eragrostis curvula]
AQVPVSFRALRRGWPSLKFKQRKPGSSEPAHQPIPLVSDSVVILSYFIEVRASSIPALYLPPLSSGPPIPHPLLGRLPPLPPGAALPGPASTSALVVSAAIEKACVNGFEAPSLVEPSCWPQNQLIHFWAPTFKWGISIANIADFAKPPEKISYPQQVAVACTGIVWSRYSMVITPRNWNLLSVNVAMAGTGLYQLSRKIRQDYFSEEKEAPAALEG